MGKLGGEKVALTDFRIPYAVKKSGRVHDLSSNLLLQQRVSDSADQLLVGGTITTANTLNSVGFQPTATSPTGMQAVSYVDTNTRITFDNSVIADTLNFTTREFTISMWVSGSTFARTTRALSQSCRIISSGAEGTQFSLGILDDLSPFDGAASLFACAVTSGSSANVVACTLNLVGVQAGDIPTTAQVSILFPSLFGTTPYRGYGGRYYEVNNLPIFRREKSIDATTPTWNHVVYVQRSAEDKTALSYSGQFEAPVSPRERLSRSGKEGRCEMWLNGELVYTSPAAGPFPESFSPYFYEDGLDSLNGSLAPVYPEHAISAKVLRQPDAIAALTGSGDNGDGVAQLAIWRRCLSHDEIKSIYQGTVDGVYTSQFTSYSIPPKKMLEDVGEIYQPPLNEGYTDSTIGFNRTPFTDRDKKTSTRESTYQGNMLKEFVSTQEESSIFENPNIRKFPSQAFVDSEELTQSVEDPESVVPSGSSRIKILLPNITSSSIAIRGQYTGSTNTTVIVQSGLDSRSQIIGTGFLYYSPARKMWIEKRPDLSTSQTTVQEYTSNPYSATNFIEQASEYLFVDGTRSPQLELENNPLFITNRIMCQFAWSPQFGYFVNHVEHLRQTGYERIGWPTGMFAAPNAPRYHAHDEESIKMRDYIDRPFLLKKIQLNVPVEATRRFSRAANLGTQEWNDQASNKKDLDNYVFFVYRQRRFSKDKDSYDDRTTSKRYLIASASICYYNSGSFGGAWSDGYYTDATSPWQQTGNEAIFSGIARPDDTVDYFGQSLTKISSSNAILHNPQHVHDWGKERFLPQSLTTPGNLTVKKTDILRLEMLPSVVPVCSVAPSLIPVTGAFVASLGATRFQYREGSDSASSIYGYMYATSGTSGSPNLDVPAPYLTLASQQWFGGTRPPAIASYSAQTWGTRGPSIPDAYDSIGSPQQLNLRGVVIKPGQVDVEARIAPAYTALSVADDRFGQVVDSVTKFAPTRGPAQSHGISMLPTWMEGSNQRKLETSDLRFQQPIDPQSVNAPIPAGSYSKPTFYGRTTYNTADPNYWGVEHGNRYMGYYGWRFISSFQLGDMTERQIYSPVILEPEDEIVIGLDAGTFGPPDIERDDLVPDGEGPTASIGRGTGFEEAGTKKSYKGTTLRNLYAANLSRSFLRIQTGEAEIVLIGEFLENGSSKTLSRDVPISSNISTYYGDENITDVNYFYNAELLSGSMFTKVFTGSEGPTGLVNGNSDPLAARRYYRDRGARKV